MSKGELRTGVIGPSEMNELAKGRPGLLKRSQDLP